MSNNILTGFEKLPANIQLIILEYIVSNAAKKSSKISLAQLTAIESEDSPEPTYQYRSTLFRRLRRLSILASNAPISTVPRGILNSNQDAFAKELVADVLWGREKALFTMLDRHPKLALARASMVSDEVGRVYRNITAFEAALYVKDAEMAYRFFRIFRRFDNEYEHLLRQYDNVYSKSIDYLEHRQTPFSFLTIINSIDKATDAECSKQLVFKQFHEENNSSELAKSMETFRRDFEVKSISELYANYKNYLQSLKDFVNHPTILCWWKEKNWNKLDLFWQQVSGFTLRFLPMNYKQIKHQGLRNYLTNISMLSVRANYRLLSFKYDSSASLHATPMKGPGFIFSSGADPAPRMRGISCRSSHIVDEFLKPFEKLDEYKTNQLRRFRFLATERRRKLENSHCSALRRNL